MKNARGKGFVQGQDLNAGLSDPRSGLFLLDIKMPKESQVPGEVASTDGKTQDLALGSSPCSRSFSAVFPSVGH